MKCKKTWIACALMALLLCCLLPNKAQAATDGVLEYEVTTGGVMITGCDTDASGEIVIPDAIDGYPVSCIGEYAFFNCSELTSVTIPDCLTSIGDYAFYGCTRLNAVYISDLTAWCSIEFYSHYANPLYYAKKLYLNGEVLSGDIVISNGATNIPAYTFYGSTELYSVTIPDGVTNIGTSAFFKCGKLTSVTIPDSVTSIGSSAFYMCSGLINVIIPDNVISIGQEAFSECVGLTSVTLGKNVTSLGNEAFFDCYALKEINFNATNLNDLRGTNRVFYKAGQGDSGIKVKIGANVCRIPNRLFYPSHESYLNPYPMIVSVEFEKESICEYIGRYSFSNCEEVKSIEIPQSVAIIDHHAFEGCVGLKLVTIPTNVTTIGDYSFQGCTSLTSITIPDSVTTVGAFAFQWCTGMESLTIGNGVTDIGNYAFSSCSNLSKLLIGDSVTRIGVQAFYGCIGLTTVTIPDSVANMELEAFYGCTDLKEITFEGSVPVISNNAFGKISAMAYYPVKNESWTDDVRLNYGGSMTWCAYGNGIVSVCRGGNNVQLCNTVMDALEACVSENQYIVLNTDIPVMVSLTRDLYIDLNGYELSGTIALNGYKIYGIDSTTDGYSCENMGYFSCVDENGNTVVPQTHFKGSVEMLGGVKRYLAVEKENGYTFHRFYLGVTHASIKPGVGGVGYKAVFAGDEMVQAAIESYGYSLQLDGFELVTAEKTGSPASRKAFTVRINGFDVDTYGETTLTAQVYITVNGETIRASAYTSTVKDMVCAMDANAAAYTQTQITALKKWLYEYTLPKSWNLITI